MNQETQKMLQQLADKLGVTVQYLWATLIQGNRIEGAILFGFVAIGLVAAFVSYKFFKVALSKGTNWEADNYFVGGWVSGAASVVLVFGFSYWAIMDTFCPAYGALADILAHIK